MIIKKKKTNPKNKYKNIKAHYENYFNLMADVEKLNKELEEELSKQEEEESFTIQSDLILEIGAA